MQAFWYTAVSSDGHMPSYVDGHKRIEEENIRLTAQPFMARLYFTSEDAEYDLSFRGDDVVRGLDES